MENKIPIEGKKEKGNNAVETKPCKIDDGDGEKVINRVKKLSLNKSRRR